MPRGGRRPGAGNKKGNKHGRTKKRLADLDLYRELVRPRLAEVAAAQLSLAIGDHMLLERTPKGFVEVTDKRRAQELLKTGFAVRVALRPGNPVAQKDIHDRVYGKPAETLQLTEPPEGTRVTHEVVFVEKKGTP